MIAYSLTPFGKAFQVVTKDYPATIELEQIEELKCLGFKVEPLVSAGIYVWYTGDFGEKSLVAGGRHEWGSLVSGTLSPDHAYTKEELLNIVEPETEELFGRGDINAALNAKLLGVSVQTVLYFFDSKTSTKDTSLTKLARAIAKEYNIDPSDPKVVWRVNNADPERIKKMYG